MSTSRFTIGTVPQEFIVQASNIMGKGKAESPCLFVPFSIAFVPYRSGETGPSASFEIINISAELSVTTANFRVSEASIQSAFPVYQSNSYGGSFRFMLTAENLFYIEKHREADLPASLMIGLTIAHHENLPPSKPGGYSQRVIRGFEHAQAHIDFKIEQSLWVGKILPGLGYNAGSLVELPATSLLLPKEYAIAKAELEEANRYFIEGDFDKAVAHCQSAIEPLQKQFYKVKDGVESKSEFRWLKQHFSATYDYIEAILGANYTIANKSHHPPSFDNFGRAEATTIVGTTTYLLSYFGKVVPDQLPSGL
jgi:hypothetical protein